MPFASVRDVPLNMLYRTHQSYAPATDFVYAIRSALNRLDTLSSGRAVYFLQAKDALYLDVFSTTYPPSGDLTLFTISVCVLDNGRYLVRRGSWCRIFDVEISCVRLLVALMGSKLDPHNSAPRFDIPGAKTR